MRFFVMASLCGLLAINTATAVAEQSSGAVAITPKMQKTAESLIEKGLADNLGYSLVESLTTEIGPRLAGSEAEARARDWAVKKLKKLGFKNVHIEPFEIPHWERGVETAEIISPFPQKLLVTALGGSGATPESGVEGDLVAFPTLDALKAAKDGSLKGKIVFIDELMTRTQDGSGYSVAVAKRRDTAYQAHRVGAVAALIRSVGTSHHRFPHTGQMKRVTGDTGQKSVPTAALSAPDADQLARALKREKPVRLRVTLTPESKGIAKSGNVIADIPGRERPDEFVVIGAHLDAWDLGTGAIDDGAGVGIVVAAANLIKNSLPKAPKRTIRVILFGAEEIGLVGSKAYAEANKDIMDKHIIGSESDFGADVIWRFDTRVADSKLSVTNEIGKLLRPLGIGPGHNEADGGPDMKYLREAGVPVVELLQNGWDYFDLHHTPDDTLDKVEIEKLRQNIAAYAAFAYLAAEVDAHFRE